MHRVKQLFALYVAVVWVLFASPAETAERKALVIGNNNYVNVPALRNARSDAEAIARSLRELGFKVDLHTNLEQRQMLGAVRSFIGRLNGGDEAVFYYSGHGVQLGAANYLLPVDIQPHDDVQIRDEALPLQRVLDDLTERRVRFSIAIVDACRDNPFPKLAGRSIGNSRGLAPTNPATGQVVLFSAGAGQSALDFLSPQDRDPNGLFTRVLLQQMREPGIPVDQVLRNVRERVVSLARSIGHEQVPAIYDQSIGRFYFKAPPNGATASPPVAAATAATPEAGTTTLPPLPSALPTLTVAKFSSAIDSESWREYLNARPADLEMMIQTQISKIGRFKLVAAAAPGQGDETADYVLTGLITEFSRARRETRASEFATAGVSTILGVDVQLVRRTTGEIIAADSIIVKDATTSAVNFGTTQQSTVAQSQLTALQRRAAKRVVAAITHAIYPISVSRVDGNIVVLDGGEAVFSVNDEIFVGGEYDSSTLRVTEAANGFAKAILIAGSMPRVGDAIRLKPQHRNLGEHREMHFTTKR